MTSLLRAPVRFIGARPVITAIAGAFTIAFSGIIVRLSHAEPATAATFRCLYAVPFLIPLAVLERRRAPGRSRRSSLLGATAGVLFAVDLLAWHYAIRDIGAGLSTTLANAQAVVIAIVAWLVLREHVQRTTIAALPWRSASSSSPASSSTARTEPIPIRALSSGSSPPSPTRRSSS